MTTSSPRHHRWADLPSQALTESIGRRYFTGQRVTVARFELKRGGLVARHVHENEQVSCVLSGSLRFTFDDHEVVVVAGEAMEIPGGVPHEVAVLEDTVVIDVFSPVRQDWIEGADAYLRGVRG